MTDTFPSQFSSSGRDWVKRRSSRQEPHSSVVRIGTRDDPIQGCRLGSCCAGKPVGHIRRRPSMATGSIGAKPRCFVHYASLAACTTKGTQTDALLFPNQFLRACLFRPAPIDFPRSAVPSSLPLPLVESILSEMGLRVSLILRYFKCHIKIRYTILE